MRAGGGLFVLKRNSLACDIKNPTVGWLAECVSEFLLSVPARL